MNVIPEADSQPNKRDKRNFLGGVVSFVEPEVTIDETKKKAMGVIEHAEKKSKRWGTWKNPSLTWNISWGFYKNPKAYLKACKKVLEDIKEDEENEMLNKTWSWVMVLKNWTMAQEPIVKVVMLVLDSLMHDNPIAFYELVMKCRDENHVLFWDTWVILEQFALMENWKIHDSIANVVNNAVVWEGLKMTLQSPIKEITDKTNENKAEAVKSTIDLSDEELYKAIKKIWEIVFDEVNKKDIWMSDRRTEWPNPYYNQTKQWFFLELYYGMPSSLWTPWWKCSIGWSGSWAFSEVVEKLIPRLWAKIHLEKKCSAMGEFWPVYTIHEIDGVKLPEPIVRNRNEFTEYDEVKKSWEKVSWKDF